MGNPDLSIVINGVVFVILGTQYVTRDEAIKIAMDQFSEYIKNLDADEDEFESVPDEIVEIQIFEIVAFVNSHDIAEFRRRQFKAIGKDKRDD